MIQNQELMESFSIMLTLMMNYIVKDKMLKKMMN